MARKRKQFKKDEGWSEKILFQQAKGHLLVAEQIFLIQDPQMHVDTIHSAGYLCQLGIELILKSCWLHQDHYFEDIHSLKELVKKCNFLELDSSYQKKQYLI